MNPNKQVRIGICSIVVMAAAWLSMMNADAHSGSEKQLDPISVGKELFAREWLAGDKRSHAGDGLGPVFNARSCAACHYQGGVGGAGPKESNATLVSVFVPIEAGARDNPRESIKLPDRAKLADIHPALRTEASFTLHRFGRDKEFARWKAGILDGRDYLKCNLPDECFEVSILAPFPSFASQGQRNIGGVTVKLISSQRNPPALFGAGLIDRIPDRVLEELAAEQAKAAEKALLASGGRKNDRDRPLNPLTCEPLIPVAGRVARLPDGRIGRFGWKSQVASLREFTLQACSTEIGLEVPGFPRAAPPWKRDYQAPGLDLSADQCSSLIRFVASLPAPGKRSAETPQHATEIASGKKLFDSVGCTECHRPKLGDVDEIYSDLLLHDMGQLLSSAGFYTTIAAGPSSENQLEPLPVPTGRITPETAREKKGKFGAGSNEWRTPPLWGLRDTPPYLHDGRADTIATAVALHGGEGQTAALKFLRLTPGERQQVELFLQSLVAPRLVQAGLTIFFGNDY